MVFSPPQVAAERKDTHGDLDSDSPRQQIHPRASDSGREENIAQGARPLSVQPKHPRALPTLLEALALWQGERVHGALVADEQAAMSGTSIYRDTFDHIEPTPLFQLDVVGRHPRRRDAGGVLRGMGDFRDLRQLLSWEVAK
jgi:hypothetical protein